MEQQQESINVVVPKEEPVTNDTPVPKEEAVTNDTPVPKEESATTTINNDTPATATTDNETQAEKEFRELIKERMKKEPPTIKLKPLQEGLVTKYECCFCEKELSDDKDPVLACGECKHFVYCSPECKAKDWLGSHEQRCFAACHFLPRKEIQSSMLRLVWRNRKWGNQFIAAHEIARGQLVMQRVPLLLLIQLTTGVTKQLRDWQRDSMLRDIAIANAEFKADENENELTKPYYAAWDDEEMFQGLDHKTFSPTGRLALMVLLMKHAMVGRKFFSDKWTGEQAEAEEILQIREYALSRLNKDPNATARGDINGLFTPDFVTDAYNLIAMNIVYLYESINKRMPVAYAFDPVLAMFNHSCKQ